MKSADGTASAMSALLRPVAALTVVVLSIAGCRTVERLIDPSPTPEACLSIGEQADGPPLTIEFLRDGPWDALVAEVVTAGEGRYNTPDGSVTTSRGSSKGGSGPAIITRYGIGGVEVLRGSEPTSDAVALRGGTVGCSRMDAHPRPDLRAGGRYVLWLRTGQFADGAEDPNLPQVIDAWPINQGFITTPNDGSITLAELRERLAAEDGP